MLSMRSPATVIRIWRAGSSGVIALVALRLLVDGELSAADIDELCWVAAQSEIASWHRR
jgi:hypothetical protein